MAPTNEAADRDLRIGGHGSGLTDAQMSHINALVDARTGRVEARASRYVLEAELRITKWVGLMVVGSTVVMFVWFIVLPGK